MITDFIHITGVELIRYEEVLRYEGSGGVIYSLDMMGWLKLFIIGIGSFYATVVGLLSLDIVIKNLKSKGRITPVTALLMVSLLTGIGVYMGRFLRFNSWDLLAPVGRIENLLEAADQFSWQFSLAFLGYTLGVFGIYQIFKKKSG